jgi:hypothetical protein
MNSELQDLILNKDQTGRNNSQIFVFEELYKRFQFNPITIVETGCIRNPNEIYKKGDGWGTLSWIHWAKKTNSIIYSIDINQYHLNVAKNVIGLSPYVNYALSDSVSYLQNLPNYFKINLLFLDSFDYCGDEENKKAAAEHQLKEFQACEKNLQENSLVLLDDILDSNFSGKGALSIPYMLKNGWKIINFQDNQVLLSKI